MPGLAMTTATRTSSIIATFKSVTCNANEKYFKNIPLIARAQMLKRNHLILKKRVEELAAISGINKITWGARTFF